MFTDNKLLYACLAGSIALHSAVVLFAPHLRAREEPPSLRISATLRQAEPPAAAPQASAPQASPPLAAPTAAPEAKPEPPTPPAPPSPQPKPEARPLAPADGKAPRVRPDERAAEARPVAPPATQAPAATAANPPTPAVAAEARTEARPEARGEREAPRPPAAAVASAGELSDRELVAQYQNQLAGIVETRKLKRYPNEAMQNGWEGTATVLLKIGSDGKVAGVETSTSSGHEMLDEQARISISKAKPFVQIPEGLKGKAFEARVRVVFSLKN